MNIEEINTIRKLSIEAINMERAPSKEAVTSRREAEKYYKTIRGLLFDSEIDELYNRHTRMTREPNMKVALRTLSQYE